MKKTWIRCPKCEAFGETRTIAVVLPNGDVSIQRQLALGRRDYTIVSGKDFLLSCGHCGEPVFIRKEENERAIFSYRSWGFHWGTLIQQIGTGGTPSLQAA